MGIFSQAGRPMRFRSAAGPDALLLNRFTGAEAISELFHFQLGLLAEEEVDFSAVLGKPAAIDIDLPNGAQRFVHGMICRLTQGGRLSAPGRNPLIRYDAELVPQLWLLTRRVRSRLIQDQSLPDIVSQLCKEWHLDHQLNLTRVYSRRAYRVQYNESDYQFFRRITAEDGVSFYFQHERDRHRLIVTDAPTQFPDLENGTVAYDEAEPTGLRRACIRDWKKTQEVRANEWVLRDYCFEMPNNDLTARAGSAHEETVTVGRVPHGLYHPYRPEDVDLLVHNQYPGGYGQRYDGIGPDASTNIRQSELEKIGADKDWLARVRLQEDQAAGFFVAGASDCAHFCPGYKFTLAHHYDSAVPVGKDDLFLLTSVEHVGNAGGFYEPEVTGPALYSNQFRGVPFAAPYRPPQTPKPQIPGPQTAVVVGPKDTEIFLDLYGRVKVRFHWQDRGDPTSSCWVRVAQFWAGKNWGAHFFPRVGHEVVVLFEDGDPDRPLIVGSVYNDVNRPALGLPENSMRSGIVSHTFDDKPGKFNAIIFHDTPGAEHVQVHSQRNDAHNSEGNQSEYSPKGKFEFHGSF
jgi:type VI secretion system secreted protein VgrG